MEGKAKFGQSEFNPRPFSLHDHTPLGLFRAPPYQARRIQLPAIAEAILTILIIYYHILPENFINYTDTVWGLIFGKITPVFGIGLLSWYKVGKTYYSLDSFFIKAWLLSKIIVAFLFFLELQKEDEQHEHVLEQLSD